MWKFYYLMSPLFWQYHRNILGKLNYSLYGQRNDIRPFMLSLVLCPSIVRCSIKTVWSFLTLDRFQLSLWFWQIGLLGGHDCDQDVPWLPEMRHTMSIGYQGSPEIVTLSLNLNKSQTLANSCQIPFKALAGLPDGSKLLATLSFRVSKWG